MGICVKRMTIIIPIIVIVILISLDDSVVSTIYKINSNQTSSFPSLFIQSNYNNTNVINIQLCCKRDRQLSIFSRVSKLIHHISKGKRRIYQKFKVIVRPLIPARILPHHPTNKAISKPLPPAKLPPQQPKPPTSVPEDLKAFTKPPLPPTKLLPPLTRLVPPTQLLPPHPKEILNPITYFKHQIMAHNIIWSPDPKHIKDIAKLKPPPAKLTAPNPKNNEAIAKPPPSAKLSPPRPKRNKPNNAKRKPPAKIPPPYPKPSSPVKEFTLQPNLSKKIASQLPPRIHKACSDEARPKCKEYRKDRISYQTCMTYYIHECLSKY